MVEDYTISSKFSKAVLKYIKGKYNIDQAAFLTTRNLYTTMDLGAIASERLIKDINLKFSRVNNFILTTALWENNNHSVFRMVTKEWSKDLNNGIIVIPDYIIKGILVEIGSNKNTDLLTDTVIISFVKVKNYYIMVGDFLSFVF